MPVTVRPATAADAGAIAATQVATWRAAYRGIVPDAFLERMDETARAARWRVGLEERPGAQDAFLAEVDGEIAGFAIVSPAAHGEPPGTGELLAIYVRLQRWERGVGSALERACVDALLAAGTERAILWVLRDNHHARAFYEHRGWETDGAELDHSFGEHGSAPVVCYRRSLRRGRDGTSPA